MDRRGFLVTLFGAATAAVILPKLDVIAAALPADSPALDVALWQGTYAAALEEAHRLFLREMSIRGIAILPAHISPSSRLGQLTDEGVMLREWRNVAETSVDHERCLEPAMKAMADALAIRGVDRFGTLSCPAGCEFAGSRGPLRMVVQHTMYDDMLNTRFDVIGGSSPDGERKARQFNAKLTKQSIRRRLGTYPSPERLAA